MTHVQVLTTSKPIDFSVARPGTNVILVAEEKEIHVNKEFLSSFSPYFNTLLTSPNFVESSYGRVKIEYDYDPLLRCIEIVHGGGPLPLGDMDPRLLSQLCAAADRFDLPVVSRFCEAEMAAHSTDLVTMFHLAYHFKFDQAKAVLLKKSTGKDVREWITSNTNGRTIDDFSLARPGTDIVLVAEEKEIHVNKEFLSSFSPYFKTLLTSPKFVESSSARVDVDYCYAPLLRCIAIVYGCGPLPIGNMLAISVEKLCLVAQDFDFPIVRHFCEAEIAAHSTDLIVMFHLAGRFNFAKAKAVILEKISGKDVREWLDSNPLNRFKDAATVDVHMNLSELYKLMQLLV